MWQKDVPKTELDTVGILLVSREAGKCGRRMCLRLVWQKDVPKTIFCFQTVKY